jgi:hypothetical protein
LGFPTGWLITTHKDACCTSTSLASNTFSGAVAGEERRLLQGEFFTHTLFTLFYCFALLYFILPALLFIKNPKKLESSVAVLLTCF